MRRRIAAIVVAALVLILCPSAAWAAAGDFDTSFGNDGVVTTDFQGLDDSGNRMAVYPDGRILVVGNSFNGATWDLAFARYLPSGGLDATFGNGGKRVFDVFGHNEFALSLVLLSDGKFLLGMRCDGPPSVCPSYSVARLAADGNSFDAGFGTNGRAPVDVTSSDLALQSDNKIVVAGSWGASAARLVRLQANGSLDSTFGSGGIVDAGTTFASQFYRVILDSAQRIVVSGYEDTSSGTETQRNVAVRRYLANGSLDTTFSNDGKALAFIGPDAIVRGLGLQTGDRPVVGATYDHTGGSFSSRLTLIKFLANGSPDGGFGTNGILYRDGRPGVGAMRIMSDDRILVASSSSRTWHFGRYMPNGVVDESFGEISKTMVTDSSGSVSLGDLSVEPDGDFLAVGTLKSSGPFDQVLAKIKGGESSSTSESANAEQTTAVTVPQGEGVLAISLTQATVDLGDLAAGSSSSAGVGAIVYTNTLGSTSSWGATVASTSLVSGVDAVSFTDLTFTPGTTVTPGGGWATGQAGSFSGDDSFPSNYSEPRTLITATASDQGEFTQSGSALAVDVPADQATGSYTGTLQYTITG